MEIKVNIKSQTGSFTRVALLNTQSGLLRFLDNNEWSCMAEEKRMNKGVFQIEECPVVSEVKRDVVDEVITIKQDYPVVDPVKAEKTFLMQVFNLIRNKFHEWKENCKRVGAKLSGHGSKL